MVSAPDAQTPALSIVVGGHGPERALEACLTSLDAQRDGAEVIVCESQPSSPELRKRFEWARFVESRDDLVPHLWRDGIDASRGRIVALTNSTMVPAEDWLACLEREHRSYDVVAGAIEPAPRLRLGDWAEYFCRYSPDMLPFEGHESVDLPGDNASYKRELLERTRDLYQDGFWEPTIHRRLSADGVRLWQSPAVIVRQGRSSGTLAFLRQRLHHGRAHGAERAERLSPTENATRMLTAPLVPAVLTARVGGRVFAARRLRLRFIAALPLLVLFNLAWAAGEAAGHASEWRSR